MQFFLEQSQRFHNQKDKEEGLMKMMIMKKKNKKKYISKIVEKMMNQLFELFD